MSEEERAAETSKVGGGKSEDDSQTSESDNKKRCCARCRNHETELVELKGHKNYCPWRDCFCELCLKTAFRQKLMADQTATRRKRVEMERRAKKGLPLVVPSVNDAKRLKTSTPFILPPEPAPIVSLTPPTTFQPSRPREVSWEAITELMNRFNFNVNTSCLLYLILKYISNNVKDAHSIILRAKEDIKKMSNNTLNGGTTPVVQSMYTMNQLEVVPLFVVPSEKVLDLSYQPSLGYPRSATQSYPYPRTGTPPPAPCLGWKQAFRQPTWPSPTQPYERVPIPPYHEVPKDDKERRDENLVDKRRDPEARTAEEEKTEVRKEEDQESGSKDVFLREPMDTDDSAVGNTASVNSKKEKDNINEGLSKVDVKDEGVYKHKVYRPFQEPVKGEISKPSLFGKDEFSAYGEHVGNQLRSLNDRHSLTVARHEIDRVIFKAIMGEYYVRNCQSCQQDGTKDAKYTEKSSPSEKVRPTPGFQPYRPAVEPPVQPQPIRPHLNAINWC